MAGGADATPFDVSHDGLEADTCTDCSQYDASLMQIVYGGTGDHRMAGGNSQSAATVLRAERELQPSGHPGFLRLHPREDHRPTAAATRSIHYDRRFAATSDVPAIR